MKEREQAPYVYQVINQQGQAIMETKHSECRYPPRTELSILNAGLAIKINGKKLLKKEIPNEVGSRGGS